MRWKSDPAAPQTVRGAAGIIRGKWPTKPLSRRQDARAGAEPMPYDICFGARTFIPRRFTETSIFSAGFADCGRPYVTTS